MAKVTVVIPNYNGKHFMDACMSALAKQTYTDFRVLIVDNGSTDGSVAYLKALVAETSVEVLYMAENTGFSTAVNAGIALSDTEYVILLNNDTEVFPDYIEQLVAAAERGPKPERTFAASPMMIQLYHQELLDDAGDGYCYLGWAFQRGVGQPVSEPKFQQEKTVFSACAGAALYRRKVFEEIRLKKTETTVRVHGFDHLAYDPVDAVCLGLPENQLRKKLSLLYNEDDAQATRKQRKVFGELVSEIEIPSYFDPMHFAYLEDLDVSFRAGIHGYRVCYAPDAKVYHVGSGTSGSRYNAFKVRLAARNNVFLNYKNMPLLMLLLNLPGILLGVLVKIAFFARLGFAKDYISGFFEGISKLPAIHKHKTGYRPWRTWNYLVLEARLLADTCSYVQDVLKRHL